MGDSSNILERLHQSLRKHLCHLEKGHLNYKNNVNDAQMLKKFILYIFYWSFCFNCIKKAKVYLIC